MNVGTYKITSGLATSPYYRKLNLYSSGSVSNGMNVVLYETDQSDEQKWYFDGERLYPETDSTHSYCLDRYAASTYLNNADIWEASAADADCQKLSIVPVSADDDYYRIRLNTKVNNEYYYLTAYSNANGTGAGKSTVSAGNVYWAPATGGLNQKWDFSEVGGSGSGNNNTGNTVPVKGEQITTFPTSAYFSGNNASYNLDADLVGECTWYCNGRAYEKKGIGNISTAGAGSWYSNVGSRFTRLNASATPVADSIGCFSQGHVVYIEAVNIENGTTYVYFTEANWYKDERLSNKEYESLDTPVKGTDGVVKKLSLYEFRNRSNGTYQGCIVL